MTEKMAVYLYRFDPCDVYPDLRVGSTRELLSTPEGFVRYEGFGSERIEALMKLVPKDSEIREGPYVFWLPAETECALGLWWKEEDNGTCVAVSEVPLVHLLHEGESQKVSVVFVEGGCCGE